MIILFLLSIILIKYSKVYNLPSPTGPYKVGYKHIADSKENLNFGVYYPCKESKNFIFILKKAHSYEEASWLNRSISK